MSGARARTAGYSGTPLAKKLGIRPGDTVAILGAPAGYRRILGALPTGAKRATRPRADMDFIQFFSKRLAELEQQVPVLKRRLADTGALWISWPKGGSAMETDLKEGMVQAVGLKNGLVDVKVCAIDETWSGLKFVYRLKDRGKHKNSRSP